MYCCKIKLLVRYKYLIQSRGITTLSGTSSIVSNQTKEQGMDWIQPPTTKLEIRLCYSLLRYTKFDDNVDDPSFICLLSIYIRLVGCNIHSFSTLQWWLYPLVLTCRYNCYLHSLSWCQPPIMKCIVPLLLPFCISTDPCLLHVNF